MYAKNTRLGVKHEVQKERSAKRNDQIARPRRAQTRQLFSTMIFFIKRIAADMFKSRAWHYCINLK